MATFYGMEQVVTGMEGTFFEGAVRCPEDGSLNLVFRDPSSTDGLKCHVVWVASDAEGNGNGALHIQSEDDPTGEKTTIIE